MDLQSRLLQVFPRWSPDPPTLVSRGSGEVTLVFSAGPFNFITGLLYIVQRKEKIPPWVTVYSGGKTRATIANLAPGHAHRFRLQVLVRASVVHNMADLARARHGDDVSEELDKIEEAVRGRAADTQEDNMSSPPGRCLRSAWSGEVWSSTEGRGTSAACFCMAVRCGYLVQVQQMLEERPELVSVVNSSSGLTPLATAARRGDTGMVRQLLLSGAEVDQLSAGARTALHVATLHARVTTVELLLASGADCSCRDVNSMRVEHFAVDSGDLETIQLVLRRGDSSVLDSNGWTPLFRAVVQGASVEIVKELLERGSDVNVSDRRGLTLAAAARLLKGRMNKNRESTLKLVDCQYQHEKVVANFTRITKKISSIQTLLARK